MTDLSASTGSPHQVSARRARLSPNAALAALLLPLPVLLLLVRTLPIGPMYWDLLIYFDAANRIFDGQNPNVDFFAPAGPLGYWLFAAGLKLFPNAQPLLLVDWSLLAVSAPLMAVVVSDVARRSYRIAFALLLPFVFLSVLPFNVETYSSFPGVDGFGIYNRQGARLLYVLAAALLFCRDARRLGVAVAGAMLALFLVKITAFLAGGLLCVLALVAGRVRIATASFATLGFAGALGLLQAATGVPGAYLADIGTLVAMNQGGLLARFLQSASQHFGVLLPCLLLTAVLAAFRAGPIRADIRMALRGPCRFAACRALADREAVWVATSTFAALFYETQNTGSQAFIFVWPALLLALLRFETARPRRKGLVVVLVAASFLPAVTTLAERSARAFIGSVKYVELNDADLSTLGAVTQRPEFMQRATLMLDVYARNAGLFGWYATEGELPSPTLYAEPDYQILFLRTLGEAIEALELYEMANDVRFETMLNLGFVNPFPYLLDRHAPRLVAIGADPSRTMPPASEALGEAIRATDIALYAKCPETAPNLDILNYYAPFLGEHRRISLGRCWDAFVRAELAR